MRHRSIPTPHKGIYALVWIGQSNATGNGGINGYSSKNAYTNSIGSIIPLTKQPLLHCVTSQLGPQPSNANMTAVNPSGSTLAAILPFTPIYEGRNFGLGALPLCGESGATACTLFLANRTKQKFLAAVAASNGQVYSVMAQGTDQYNWGKAVVQQAVAQYGRNGVKVLGTCCIHGEANASLGAATTTVTGSTSLPAASLTTGVFTAGASTAVGTGFLSGGGVLLVQTTNSYQYLTYTGASSGSFTGVSGGTGTIQAGGLVVRADYYQDLVNWQANYQTDLSALTSQQVAVNPIPMFACPQSYYSNANATNTGMTDLMLYEAWKAGLANTPSSIVLVGPRYQYPASLVSTTILGIHLNNAAEQWHGEMYGKVIWKTMFLGQQWLPLYPTSFSRTTNVIVVTFNVPSGNLTYDARMVRYVTNWGFSYSDSGGTITISSVAVTASNQVTITLSADPSANTLRFLSYANGPIGGNIGNMSETRGNLRDQDQEVSSYGFPLYNWCVPFSEYIA